MSDNLLKRTLTMKSKIGFGHYFNMTVEEMFISRNQVKLIDMYYCLEKIDFTEDILEKLCITERIEKPGKDITKKYDAIGKFIKKERDSRTDEENFKIARQYQQFRKKNSKARQGNAEAITRNKALLANKNQTHRLYKRDKY